MGTPRLKGRSLSIARAAANTPPLSGLLWSKTRRDFGLAELLRLPRDARAPFDLEARPVAGAPPRQWDDAQLDAPDGRRTTTRRLRETYQRGRITPTHVLDNIEKRLEQGAFGEATHSPFSDLDLEVAKQAASESTARWAQREPLSLLDGVPVPVKDEHDVVGLVTRGGTQYRTEPARTDSFCVQRLRQAGALVYAQTHTTEWGMNPIGFNPHFAMPRNAYSSAHAPGGSSTGSAIAVALGLCTVAVGSDGGSSIRAPSALNGLFGLKPTFVRVGRSGDLFANSTMSHIGPIGQSTEDLVDLLEVIGTVPDGRDPISAYAPDLPDPGGAWRRALGRGVRGCRIGVLESEWAGADPAIARLCREALRALEREGAILTQITLPLAAHAPAIGVLTIVCETMAGLFDDIHEHGALMGDDLRLLLGLARQIPARDYFAACCTRAALRRDLAARFADLDLIALPSVATVAPPWPLEDNRIAIADDAATQSLCRFSWLGNVAGLPASSVPVGQHMGLPVGLMLMGDAWDEASVVAATAHVERLGIRDLPQPPGWVSLAD